VRAVGPWLAGRRSLVSILRTRTRRQTAPGRGKVPAPSCAHSSAPISHEPRYRITARQGLPRPALQRERRTENGGRRTEDRGRKTEDGGPRTEDGKRRNKTWPFGFVLHSLRVASPFCAEATWHRGVCRGVTWWREALPWRLWARVSAWRARAPGRSFACRWPA